MGREAGRATKNRGAHSVSQASAQPLTSTPGPRLPIPKPHLPTGGRLRHFSKAWENITSDTWTQSVIRSGYRIQFRVRPHVLWRLPPLHVRTVPSNQEKLRLLCDEVKSLLEKRAIERVTDRHSPTGYFSRIFLVRKKTGGWRPIIDLSQLNRLISAPHFKMETLDKVRLSLNAGDWVTSLDLTDAYFHIAIHPRSRRYLRFTFQGVVYQFRALPFGLCTAPYVFTRVVKATLRFIHQQGVRLHAYLDDWLQPASSKELAKSHMQVVLKETLRLGFHSQLGEVRAGASTSLCIPGSSVRPIARPDRPLIGSYCTHPGPNLGYAGSTRSFSTGTTCAIGPNGINGSALAAGPCTQTPATMGDQVSVVPGMQFLGQGHRSASLVSGCSLPVAGPGVSVLHGPSPPSRSRSAALYGRQSVRLGCTLGGSHGIRQVVSVLEPASYQHTRTTSSVAGSAPICSSGRRPLCTSNNGQYHSGCLCEQGGGLEVQASLPFDGENPDLVCRALCHADGSFPSRESEHPSRQSVPQGRYCADRVDHTCGDSPPNIQSLGDPTCGPLCHHAEPSAADVLLPSSRSECSGSRLIGSFVGGAERLCLPPLSTPIEGDHENQHRTMSSSVDRSTLAGPALVRQLLSLLVEIPICLPHRHDLLHQPRSRRCHDNPVMLHLHAFLLCKDVCRRREFLNRLPSASVHPNGLPPTQSMGIGGSLGWVGVSEGKWIPSVLL